ncbi:sporulation protein YunB [Paenibacillus sp. HB172176]|uniref:sporulation protein YunB n=1 Tax=Paenibacillus sp. HB172176 TaxID=2493690 RepID=UPI001F0F4379|nr:sporulation protein YunB [Paenibacillus sp. HB172176]
MARWGRRSVSWWLQMLRGGAHAGKWHGGSIRRAKTVSWGSPKPQAGSGKPAARWGAKPSPLSFGKQAVSASRSASWGSVKPREPRKRIRKRTLLLWALLLMLLSVLPAFIYIENKLRPPLMDLAKIRVKQVATEAINKAITEQVSSNASSEDLIDWKLNKEGKISGFMLDYKEHMRITSQTINTVQSTLDDMKEIPERIPLGHALHSAIISSFGPKVPVRFEPQGAVKVELSTRERNAGINMVLVEVYIDVMTEMSIIIPFDTDPEIVQTEIPISYLLVVGDVPMYYYDGTGKAVGESAPEAPNISVPLAPGTSVSSSGKESGGSLSAEGIDDAAAAQP